jgi:hypothetical protein
MDRARSKRKWPDSGILLRGPDGHLHLMQKALANGPQSFSSPPG